MLTIALTGGIACGKSTVLQYFKLLAQEHSLIKLNIIDADQISRQLLSGTLSKNNTKDTNLALYQVYKIFGHSIFNPSQQIDRAQLRKLIFSSKKNKKKLEDILHPLIYNEICQQKQIIQQQNTAYNLLIMDIPLLFESRQTYSYDRCLVINTSKKLQISRSIQRDQCSEEIVKQIIANQLSQTERLNQADDVVNNNKTLKALHSQAEHIFQYYCSLLSTEAI